MKRRDRSPTRSDAACCLSPEWELETRIANMISLWNCLEDPSSRPCLDLYFSFTSLQWSVSDRPVLQDRAGALSGTCGRFGTCWSVTEGRGVARTDAFTNEGHSVNSCGQFPRSSVFFFPFSIKKSWKSIIFLIALLALSGFRKWAWRRGRSQHLAVMFAQDLIPNLFGFLLQEKAKEFDFRPVIDRLETLTLVVWIRTLSRWLNSWFYFF